MSLVTPGAGTFLPQGHNLNKFGSGLLGDTTYQISRLNALWFQRRIYFHVFPKIAIVKHVTPGAGPILAQGHNLNKLGRGSLVDVTYQIPRL